MTKANRETQIHGSNPYIWMRKESIEKERIRVDNVKEMEDET